MESAEKVDLSFGETLVKIVELALSRPAPSIPVVQKPEEKKTDQTKELK